MPKKQNTKRILKHTLKIHNKIPNNNIRSNYSVYWIDIQFPILFLDTNKYRNRSDSSFKSINPDCSSTISKILEMRVRVWGICISKGDLTSPVVNDRISRRRSGGISKILNMWHCCIIWDGFLTKYETVFIVLKFFFTVLVMIRIYN